MNDRAVGRVGDIPAAVTPALLLLPAEPPTSTFPALIGGSPCPLRRWDLLACMVLVEGETEEAEKGMEITASMLRSRVGEAGTARGMGILDDLD